MKRLPLILSALFLAITLARVAMFAQNELKAGLFGWVFSIGLGVAVYACAYWTRVKTTRKQAVMALILFVSLDAFLNFAHVWLSADTSESLIAAGAVLYGLFPTAAVALLGWLSGAISLLPPGVGERSMSKIEQAGASWITGWIESRSMVKQVSANFENAPAAEALPERIEHKYNCSSCTWGTDSQKEYAGHMSGHARRNELVKDNRQIEPIISNNGHGKVKND